MKKITLIILLTVIAGLIVYDAVLAVKGEWDATISGVMWDLTAHRMVSFAIGCVVGHFMWPIAKTMQAKLKSGGDENS
jgi:hypothetical protein